MEQTSQYHNHDNDAAPGPSTVTAGCHHLNPPLDPRQAAAFLARARKIAARVASAEAKAAEKARQQAEKEAKRLAKLHEKHRKEATAEIEAQERKVNRDAVEMQRRERRARENAEEKAAREERKKLDEEKRQRKREEAEAERRRIAHMGGVAWGFDPMAGISASNVGSSTEEYDDNGDYRRRGCLVSDGKAAQVSDRTIDEIVEIEYDDIGRRTGRLWHSGNTWGIEAGGPGQAPDFVARRQVPASSSRGKTTSPWKK